MDQRSRNERHPDRSCPEWQPGQEASPGSGAQGVSGLRSQLQRARHLAENASRNPLTAARSIPSVLSSVFGLLEQLVDRIEALEAKR